MQNGVDVLAYVAGMSDGSPCMIIGQSLGASIACAALAKTKYKVDGLILDSAFPSFRSVVHYTMLQNTGKKLPSILISFLISNRFDIKRTIKTISSPRILILHGRKDDITPFHFGEEIASICKFNSDFWPSDTGHAELFRNPSLQPGFKEKILCWMKGESHVKGI